MSVVAIADILDVVCARYGVRQQLIKSAVRTGDVIRPRQIAMYLSRRLSQRSLSQIGAALLRDHTTVLSGATRIADEMTRDHELRAEVEELEIECLAVAELRARGALAPRKPINALALAEKIVRAHDRFVIQASVEEIRALAEALLTLRAAQTESSEEEQPDAPMFRAPPPTVAAPTMPVILDAPIPLPPTLAEVVHDFLAAESVYRRSPSLNVKAARDRAITPLREHIDDSAVAALLKSYEAMVGAEFTLGERAAEERFQAAVKILSRRFSELVQAQQQEAADA
jgi:hypothetical protein